MNRKAIFQKNPGGYDRIIAFKSGKPHKAAGNYTEKWKMKELFKNE